MKWTTKDGRVIKVKDMTEEHKRNLLNWLNRKMNTKYTDLKKAIREYRELLDEMEDSYYANQQW